MQDLWCRQWESWDDRSRVDWLDHSRGGLHRPHTAHNHSPPHRCTPHTSINRIRQVAPIWTPSHKGFFWPTQVPSNCFSRNRQTERHTNTQQNQHNHSPSHHCIAQVNVLRPTWHTIGVGISQTLFVWCGTDHWQDHWPLKHNGEFQIPSILTILSCLWLFFSECNTLSFYTYVQSFPSFCPIIWKTCKYTPHAVIFCKASQNKKTQQM